MKKNILLVNSFLILPLITPSFALCSQSPKNSPDEIVKTGTQLPLISQTSLKNSGAKKRMRKEKKKRELQALPVRQATEPLIDKETTEETVIDLAMPEKTVTFDEQVSTEQYVTDKSTSKSLITELSAEEQTHAKNDLEEVKSYNNSVQEVADISTEPLIGKETTEETVIDLTMPEKKVISHEQLSTEKSATPSSTSKYLIIELSAEEQTQARNDLEKAKSYNNSVQELADIFTVIKTISPETNGLRQFQPVAIAEELPAPTKVIHIELSPDLEKSVMAPAQNTGFGLSDTIWNALSTYRSTTIRLLSQEKFEPTNATHKEYFNSALEECAAHKDMQSLTQILNLCNSKEKYTSLQSSLNHVAPAFNFVSDDYATSMMQSNKTLQSYNQECAMQINRASHELQENLAKLLQDHREKVTTIAKMFNDKVDSEQAHYNTKKNVIASLSALNAKVKEYENALLFEHPLQVPTNSVAAIEYDTHKTVRHLLTHKNMPQAKNTALKLTDK